MALLVRSQFTAFTLIVLSGLGRAQQAPSDRFITQPNRLAPRVEQPETAAIQLVPLPQPVVQQTTQQPALAPPSSGSASLNQSPANGVGGGQLRWLARSAFPNSARVVTPGPVELNNPNFVPLAPPTSVTADSLPRASSSPPLELTATAPITATPTLTEQPQNREAEPAPRKILASLVSSQIMDSRPGTEAGTRAVAPVDAPPGWQATGEKLSQQIDHCQQLLNRKAYYSAREEAETAMLHLVRVLDLMSNSYSSEPAWHAAGQAMQEAEDFSTMQRLTSDSDFLRRIILSHQTPVLKDVDATSLAPLTAAQHYRQYAELKMTDAAQGHPWAAEVIYALGRTYQAQADAAEDETQHTLRWKAVTLYRGARLIAPANAVAANQLGYVLLQMDRPLDAREAVVASLNTSPSLAAYENLVEASRRLGDAATAQWAASQALALRAAQPQPSPIPDVVEVDPRTFAAFSPYTIGPNPSPHAPATQPYRTADASTSPNHFR
jgi:hypothetical protein